MRFIPTAEGTKVAQRIREQEPGRAGELLDEFAGHLKEHYGQIGMSEHNPDQARRLLFRNLWRASAGPLLHGVEIQIAERAKGVEKEGWASFVRQSTEISDARLDRVFSGYGSFSAKQRAFLRAGTLLTSLAMRQFLHEARHEPGHWGGASWESFSQLDREENARLPRTVPWPLRSTPLVRLQDHVTAASVTALNLLESAAQHAHLWGEGGLKSTLPKYINELAMPQFITASLNERYFPPEGLDHEPSPAEDCPYTHTAERLAASGIWRTKALQNNGRDIIPRYCPNNIPLYAPEYPAYGRTTGATLRLASLIPVACETIWV